MNELPVPPADDTGGNLVEWAWAMNAASSVLGSVLAIIIAIQLGLNVTLATGAAAYLVALLLTTTLRPRQIEGDAEITTNHVDAGVPPAQSSGARQALLENLTELRSL